MTPAKAGLVLGLFVVWAVLPWPLARWTAAFVGLFLGLGALWSFLLFRSLVVGAAEPVLRAFSGRRVDVVTWVENRSPLPSGLLFVADSSGGLETWGETRRFVAARPFTRLRFTFVVRSRERGERALGPLEVKGADPTGLFPFVRRAVPRTALIYPALHRVVGWPSGGIPVGPRRWEPALLDDISRFRSHREFRPGDPLSRLAAAAWARSGIPQVRTYDRTVARPTGVVVDLRASLYPLRLRWALVEAAIETAASLVWELLGRGERVWLTVVDRGGEGRTATLGPGRGWADARGFLERLALASADKTEQADSWSPAVILPPPPLRLLWVGPAEAVLPITRGYEVVRFLVEEEGAHGPVFHP